MHFSEMLDVIKEGHAVRRISWADSEGYLKLLPDMKHVWKIMIEPNPNAGNFIFAYEDFTADDWAVYHGKQATVEGEATSEV